MEMVLLRVVGMELARISVLLGQLLPVHIRRRCSGLQQRKRQGRTQDGEDFVSEDWVGRRARKDWKFTLLTLAVRGELTNCWMGVDSFIRFCTCIWCYHYFSLLMDFLPEITLCYIGPQCCFSRAICMHRLDYDP